MPTAEEFRFRATEDKGEVSALLLAPPHPDFFFLFGHGAGAGMRHAFMESFAASLMQRNIATLRYQFPYVEAGSKRPDSRKVLLQTVRSAVAVANDRLPDVPLFAGGKSMGGRMTSLAASEERLPKVRGIIFVGFPLHPARKVSTERSDHLPAIDLPLLFLQGTRDALADLQKITEVCSALPRASLHIVQDADHSFKVLKRTGRSDEEILEELADKIATWGRSALAL